MSLSKAAVLLALIGSFTGLVPLASMQAAETDAERIARLEQRLQALEARLADQEQETKEVKVLAASSAATGAQGGQSASSGGVFSGNPLALDIMANSAWRNLRWTQEEQWAGIRKGISEEQVVDALGYPPRSVKSLKPRVDLVYWYETSLRDRNNALKGKISFRDGKVIAIQKPNFTAVKQALQSR
jgi:hypothetical protein